MITFRHVAPLAALAILLPAAAPDEPVVECETDVDVIVEGESATYDGQAGTLPTPDDAGTGDVTGLSRSEIVTIAGTAGETALKTTITAVMTWDVPGDYELRAFDADGNEIGSSVAFNPTDGNVETVVVTTDLCDEVTYVADNYLGTPAGPVSLDISVEGKRPRVRR